MGVQSWFMNLRRLGEFGDLALVHKEHPGRWEARWTVWEVGGTNDDLRYKLGEGSTPREAFRHAERELRGDLVRAKAELSQGGD